MYARKWILPLSVYSVVRKIPTCRTVTQIHITLQEKTAAMGRHSTRRQRTVSSEVSGHRGRRPQRTSTAFCPAWLDESDPSGVICTCDGQSVPPALTDRTACPWQGLLSCEFLAIPPASCPAVGILLNVYIYNRPPSVKLHMLGHFLR
jgi:hypothetical protein